jgi:hypothetical protein
MLVVAFVHGSLGLHAASSAAAEGLWGSGVRHSLTVCPLAVFLRHLEATSSTGAVQAAPAGLQVRLKCSILHRGYGLMCCLLPCTQWNRTPSSTQAEALCMSQCAPFVITRVILHYLVLIANDWNSDRIRREWWDLVGWGGAS